jgi:thymidylate synthase
VVAPNFSQIWRAMLEDLLRNGSDIYPRRLSCREIIDVVLYTRDPYMNILVDPIRNPSYRFMLAEWLWIYFGHSDVATIAQYNKHIAQYSDDGATFAGSYGEPWAQQWPRIIALLREDHDTRQAVIQIYRPPPQPSKDVPCTISIQFLVREERVHTIVNMRSSDIWLGLPYDFFNFSMLANVTAAALRLRLGGLTMHLGSSHLYHENFEKAEQIIANDTTSCFRSPQLLSAPPSWLDDVLRAKRFSSLQAPKNLISSREVNDHLWILYGAALVADTNKQALEVLQEIERWFGSPTTSTSSSS